MKTLLYITGLFGAFLLAPTAAHSQTSVYILDWFTFDGGGGVSADQNYILSGTVGQPDAGVLTGANFTVTGGFWGGFSSAVSLRPQLRITVENGALLVSWPSSASDFNLEENNTLENAQTWSPVNVMPVDNGIEKSVILSPEAGRKFLRLRRT